VLASPYLSSGQEPDDVPPDTEYLTYKGAPRPLTIVDGFVAVHHDPAAGDSAALEVLDAASGELELVRARHDWSLFAHPSLSEWSLFVPPAASEASDSSVLELLPKGRELVDSLVAKLTGPLVVSPVFRDASDLLITFGSRLAVGFQRGFSAEEVAASAEEIGATILQERLGGNSDAYLFDLPGIRSGFENAAISNDLAARAEVRWAEPELIFLNPQGPYECIALSPAPTTSELDKNWWDDGTWGINIAGAWAECGGESAPGQPIVRVGVIGDGVDLTHPDLYKLGSSIPGNGFIPGHPTDGGPVDDCDKHETLVAGMIAMVAGGGGSSSLSAVGAAPKVEIVSARANP
jgi:subtilisin family serine protease